MKDCPFCGSPSILHEINPNGVKLYYIECSECGANTGCSKHKEDVIDWWSERTDNLLPCPLCGGKASVNKVEKAGLLCVMCNDCGVSTLSSKDEAEVIALWNKRA